MTFEQKTAAAKKKEKKRKQQFRAASDYLDFKFRDASLKHVNVYDFFTTTFKKEIKKKHRKTKLKEAPKSARLKKKHHHSRSHRFYNYET